MGWEDLGEEAAVTGCTGLQGGGQKRSRTLHTGRSKGRRVWKVMAEFGEGGKPVTQSQAGEVGAPELQRRGELEEGI